VGGEASIHTSPVAGDPEATTRYLQNELPKLLLDLVA